MTMIIGPSNGWLYGEDINEIQKQKEIILSSGCNSIEISLRKNEEIEKNLLEFSGVNDFEHKSAHLPEFSSKEIDYWISKAKEFQSVWNFDYFLVHPSIIEDEGDWEKLKDSGLPIAIENMDKNKESGFKIDELKKIIDKYDFGLVLDVQHAYSHDSKMGYARKLFSKLKSKIVYFHVSGENKNMEHTLVKDSDNKEEIINFLEYARKEINVPIILEGEYISSKNLKDELNFLRNSLSH